MTTQVISFIGTGKYQPIMYGFEGKSAQQSEYILKAIHELFNPDKIWVVMTEEARKSHFDSIKSQVDFTPIDIPSGKNESELWQIFESISHVVEPDTELILDVTHGFRSQPMLLLAVAVYLQAVKNVTITKILYGAFDAKDENGIAPIFNLLPFLDIIRWSTATEQFLKYGSATLLKDILTNIHQDAYKTNNVYLPKTLKVVGQKLNGLTQSLAVVRPQEVVNFAKELPAKITDAVKDIENLPKAKPFSLLMQKIQLRLEKLSNAQGELFTNEGFIAQAEMINLCLQTEHYQQAVTLAREVFVSKMCILNNYNVITEREKGETSIYNLSNVNKTMLSDFARECSEIWGILGNLRNDINHAAMRENPINSDSLIKQIKTICARTLKIITDFNI